MESVRVGMLGLGVVGTAVASRLLGEGDLVTRRAGVRVDLCRIAVRDAGRARARIPDAVMVGTDSEALVDDASLDIVVEVIGGIDPAHGYIERVLRAGRSVVTANKAVVATHGATLLPLGGERLRFEAAVGGGIPVIEAVRNGLSAQRVTSIEAVINGTTNVILDAMAAGGDYATALRGAQRRGFAEADPSSDVDGFDAACKIAILASLATGRWTGPEAVRRTGIGHLRPGDFRAAWLCGHSIRLLATARLAGERSALSVEPTALRRSPSPHTDSRAPDAHPLAGLQGPENGVLITADMLGPLLLRGAGAGGEATAGAVIADIIALAKGMRGGAPPPSPAAGTAAPVPALPMSDDDPDTRALIVVEAADRTTDLEAVARLLDDRGVATTSIAHDTDDLPVLRAGLLTRPAPRSTIAAAVATLDADPRFEDGVRWMPARP